jgi:DNA-binding LacI/PurR family transcriptional regulator
MDFRCLLQDSGSVKRNRRPTLEDVAVVAGVSRALVSLALNDSPRVAPASKALILQAAASLDYRPNLAARNLASRRTGTIGVMLNDLHNPYYVDVFDGVSAAAADAEKSLLLTTGRNQMAGEREAIASMLAHRVDGIVLVGPLIPSAEISRLAESVAVVLVGRTVRDQRVDCVANHEAEGAAIAVRHLFTLGHRRIAHIDGGNGAGAGARRMGFERAVKNFGIDANCEVIPGDYTEAAGTSAATRILQRKTRPTALFCANDLVAIGALDTFASADVRIPEDISVIGYDNSMLARLSRIALTSIDQSTHLLGRVAVQLLNQRLDTQSGNSSSSSNAKSQRVELVTPTLIERRTTAPPPNV